MTIATQALSFTTNTTLLATELRLASKVIASKIIIPVLGNVLFRSDGETLTLQATDLELAFSTSVVAALGAPGAVTLPAAKLLQILDQLPSQDIVIALDEIGHVNVASGAFKSRLQALPAADFPILAEMSGDTTTFSAVLFRELIHKTSYAIDDEGRRLMSQMTGALFMLAPIAGDKSSAIMQIVTTDGDRLAVAWADYSGVSMPEFILPGRALKVLKEQTYVGDIEFSKDENHLFFKMGSRLLSSRMLEGKFPSWQRVIPKNDKKIAIDRITFLSALKRVSLVAEQKNQATYLILNENTLTISATSAEIGEASEPISVIYNDTPLNICCKWQYVMDFLEHASSQQITLEVRNEMTQMLFTDDAFQTVVMPMRMK